MNRFSLSYLENSITASWKGRTTIYQEVLVYSPIW